VTVARKSEAESIGYLRQTVLHQILTGNTPTPLFGPVLCGDIKG